MAQTPTPPLTHARLVELLRYDHITGLFTWEAVAGHSHAGKIAGCRKRTTDGNYIRIVIDGRNYLAHRLAWFWANGQWPDGFLDHIDCNGENNRLPNLRLATNAQNQYNSRVQARSTTGFKGVAFRPQSGRWQAHIKAAGRLFHLGSFDTPEAARDAYVVAAHQLAGEFAMAR